MTAAFTPMFVGFAAAYSLAAFCPRLRGEFDASHGDIVRVFYLCAFLCFLLRRAGGIRADRCAVNFSTPAETAPSGVSVTGVWLISHPRSRPQGTLRPTRVYLARAPDGLRGMLDRIPLRSTGRTAAEPLLTRRGAGTTISAPMLESDQGTALDRVGPNRSSTLPRRRP